MPTVANATVDIAAEREMLAQSLGSLLSRHWPADAACVDVRALRDIWLQLRDFGLAALGADPEQRSVTELSLAMECLGRAACPAPLLPAVLTNLALAPLSAEHPAAARVLAEIQRGDIIPAVALGSFDGDTQAGGCRVEAAGLSGTLGLVEDLGNATHLVTALGKGAGLAIAELSRPGVRSVACPGLSTPALHSVRLEAIPAEYFAVTDESLSELAWIARLALHSRALGASRRAFELVLDYVKIRHQFGQPIGRFQAIQHKLADCAIALESSGLLLANAANAVDRNLSSRIMQCATAIAFSGPALRQVALETQHTFGAIGFAEAHEAPRHFRRVHGDVSRLGGVRKARQELASALLTPANPGLPDTDLGEPANAFRLEVRSWLTQYWNETRRAQHHATPFTPRGLDRTFSQDLGAKGWIAVAWPPAFGGQGRGQLEQYALVEEMSYCGAPTSAHTCGAELVGPALIRFGTPTQCAEFLPAILRGERTFCLGYSEAGSGSDLASLRTEARRDGDDWIINGEKLWTTMAEHAEYHWLAVRTDPRASPPHAGISVFMVPLNSPGISISPEMAMYGQTFCSVRYDQVRVADSLRVGAVNDGWKVITYALAAERILMGAMVAAVRRLFEDLIQYLAHPDEGGRRLSDDPIVRERIAELAAQVEAARQLVVNGVRMAAMGRTPLVEAAMGKISSGEIMQRVCEAAIDLLGASATLYEGSNGAVLNGTIEQTLRRSIMMVVGGGTPQIQRSMIAIRGLELPR
jgi:alkylation response protein AidB-like acyl-CoA dehydrogenase